MGYIMSGRLPEGKCARGMREGSGGAGHTPKEPMPLTQRNSYDNDSTFVPEDGSQNTEEPSDVI